MLTSKYIFLNELKILIYKLTIISEKFVAQNINYKEACYKQIHGERKNEILIWREYWNWTVEFNLCGIEFA